MSPGGSPRRGIFGLDTTRGDRLFITLSVAASSSWPGSAFYGEPLWGGLAISLCWAFVVFRWG